MVKARPSKQGDYDGSNFYITDLGTLPRWLGWAGFAVAALQLLGGIGGIVSTTGPFAQYGGFSFLAFLLLLAWLLATSLFLTERTWSTAVSADLQAQPDKQGAPNLGTA